MQDYKSFVRDAIEQYGKLPQEQSELYKRHYVNIPFDLNSLAEDKNANKETLENYINSWASGSGIKFDLAIDGTDSIIRSGEFVKVEKTENLKDDVPGSSMFENSEDKYVAYINANADRSVLINVPDGKSASISALLMNTRRPLNTKIFVRVGNGSKLNILEYYCSSSDNTSVLGTIHEVSIGNDSELELNAIHNEDSNTVGLSFCKNRIGENSHMRFNSVYNGAQYTRVRNSIRAESIRSKIDANEVIFGSSNQRFDINTYIINAAQHTHASLESKAALMGESFCIMKGFAKIMKGAEKARSYVHERGILLDKGAKVDGLPDMSVDENDVKATHSSATAPVDPESVFYLMSKGIDETGVRKLLVTGFFAEIISRIDNTLMKEIAMSLINSKLTEEIYGRMPKIDARNVWVDARSPATTESDMFKGHYKYRGTEQGIK